MKKIPSNKTLQTKVSFNQLYLLHHAARQPDFRLLPLPEDGPPKEILMQDIEPLLEAGLIIESVAVDKDPIWRENDGLRWTLCLTRTGLDIIRSLG